MPKNGMMTVYFRWEPMIQQPTEPQVHQKSSPLSPLSGSLVRRGGGKDDRPQKIVETTGPSS